MIIIKPCVELYPTDLAGINLLKKIEIAGRVCYKSEDKITNDSAIEFVRKIIKSGHESVLEHGSVTFKITCDRGVSHELVRHRLASYSQESTRYCNYSSGKFDGKLTFIKPCFWKDGEEEECQWRSAMRYAEQQYKRLLELGASPQEARSVLPNSLKTEVVCTMNLRELRHFLKLRCAKAAHPQMREVAVMLLELLNNEIPVVFEDLVLEFLNEGILVGSGSFSISETLTTKSYKMMDNI